MAAKPVVVVTGSARGIGAAVARRFDASGYAVLVNSRHSREAGEALASELADAIYVQADVSVEADARRLIAAAQERWGRVDVLVNNAGVTHLIPHGDLDAVTRAVWEEILGTNIVGTWLMIQAAIDALRRDGGGSIVNVTSIAGMSSSGSSIPYAVSKAGLNHMTRLLANVLGPEVRVNAVAPGLVDTPWTESWTAVRQHWLSQVPLQRSGTPEDIAAVCLFLATSPLLTGQVIVADAGATVRSPL